MRYRPALLLVMLAVAVGPASARTPDAELRRELRIGADVIGAALSELLPEARRVVEVEAGYLAGQGALVIVDLASPWFRLDEHYLDVEPEMSRLEDIPDMVHGILEDLNLGLSRHQVEDLHELRGIREAERAMRAEQRALRSELRARRRALQAADGDRAESLEAEIQTLEENLAAVEAEERALQENADAVRETLESPPAPDEGVGPMPADVDLAVAESVCSYGATFRSLAADEHLNVLVRRADVSRYYVFRMAPVRACQAGDITAEALLEAGLSYQL